MIYFYEVSNHTIWHFIEFRKVKLICYDFNQARLLTGLNSLYIKEFDDINFTIYDIKLSGFTHNLGLR